MACMMKMSSFITKSIAVIMISLQQTMALPSADMLTRSSSTFKMHAVSRSNGWNKISRKVGIQNLRGGSETKNETAEITKWTPSPASDLHDNLNIFMLTGLGGASIWALYAGQPHIFKWVTLIGFFYIALDSIWLALQPSIVRSPQMILAHHVATLLVLLDPLLQPSHTIYTSACLLVEINTVLLLLRRKLSYSNLVEIPFLVTWVLLRNIWYPLLLVYFLLCALPNVFEPILPESFNAIRHKIEGRNPSSMLLVSMASWAGVCLFQFIWTRQLFATHPWFGGRKKAGAAESKDKKYL